MDYPEGPMIVSDTVARHPTELPAEGAENSLDVPASPTASAPVRSTTRQRWGVAAQAAAVLILIGLAVLFSMKGIDDRNARLYRLAYVVLLSAGGLLGLLLSRRVRRPGFSFSREAPATLSVLVVLSMLMMQPFLVVMVLLRSSPPWIDTQPPVIILVDLGLILLGGLIGLLGYLFSTPLGWLVVLATAAMMAVFVGMTLTTPATHPALVSRLGAW
jgi:hypothetical protein